MYVKLGEEYLRYDPPAADDICAVACGFAQKVLTCLKLEPPEVKAIGFDRDAAIRPALWLQTPDASPWGERYDRATVKLVAAPDGGVRFEVDVLVEYTKYYDFWRNGAYSTFEARKVDKPYMSGPEVVYRERVLAALAGAADPWVPEYVVVNTFKDVSGAGPLMTWSLAAAKVPQRVEDAVPLLWRRIFDVAVDLVRVIAEEHL